MKRLIRHLPTGNFLAPDGTWTPTPAAAAVFTDMPSVMAMRDKLALTQVELYIISGEQPNPQDDVSVPLRDAQQPPPRLS